MDFTLATATKTVSVDTFTNIIRRREDIIFKARTNNSNVNISYFASKPLNSLTSLSIADRSSSLIANRIDADSSSVTITDTDTYTINTDKFIITDEFTDPNTTIGEVPLYSQHIIDIAKVPRVSSTDLTLPATTTLVSVEILDSNFSPIQVGEIKLDTTKGIIYNNLASSYDPTTGEYTVYHVRYTVNISGVVYDYTDLLSNIDIYKVAGIDDLDLLTGRIIQDGRKVYLIEEVGNNFTVTLPTVGDYAFKVTSNAKLKIIPPPPVDINNPWSVSITNTQFYTTVLSQTLKYSVAEFNNQSWNPNQPIKKSTKEVSTFLAGNLLKTNFGKIQQDNLQDLFVDVLVNDSGGNGLAAFSTDPTKAGDIASNNAPYLYWTKFTRKGIKSIDAAGGFIEIEGYTLKSTYQLISTYYYEEDEYEFSLIDFNPINNPSSLNTKTSIFVDPDTLSSSKTQTLYYLRSDQSGKVIDSNWYGFSTESGILNDSRTLYYEKIPDFIHSPASGLALFVGEYTTEGSGVLLVLGDIEITEEDSPENGTVLDTRVRGGGIIESIVPDAKRLNPETNWYWDLGYWDGTPYPGNSSYYIEIPVGVMEGANGIFLSNQVKEIVQRHTAAGVYPVVKAYGIDPTISGVVSGSDTITIKWGSYGE